MGIEPMHICFADRCVSTSPRGHMDIFYHYTASLAMLGFGFKYGKLGTMKTLKVILIAVATVVILGSAGLFIVGYLKPKPAGLFVGTDRTASVFINGVLVGKTPYSQSSKAQDIVLRLVPESDEKLLPFETKLTLSSGIQTVVKRTFAETEELSSWQIISFEKLDSNETGLVVTSTPENAQVLLDGIPRGFTPYKTNSISASEHQITIKSPGFVDQTMNLKAVRGHKLMVFVKLATNVVPVESVEKIATPSAKLYVKILETPTGFLRMRTEPGTKGEEIAELKPGEKYPFLDEDPSSGWFKIQYREPKVGLPDGITGWISNRYSEKFEETPKEATGGATLR